jgi:hypothetical protein
MKVGNLEQAEAVEGRREIGQRLVADHGVDVEAVGASAGGQAGDFEKARDDAVDGNDAFDGERSFALVDEAGAQIGLRVEATAEEGWSEAVGHGAEVE